MKAILFWLPVFVYSALPDEQTDVIESTIVSGKNHFQCKFTLVVVRTGRMVNLRKSKVSCSPRRPRDQRANKVKLSGTLGTYLVALTINPSKIKSAEVEDSCNLGYSKVCLPGENQTCPAGLNIFCPTTMDKEKENEAPAGCTCLPTRLVQQAVQADTSPLGCQGCVCVEEVVENCGGDTTITTTTITTTATPTGTKLLFLGPGDESHGRSEVLTLPDLNQSNCTPPVHPLQSFSGYVGTKTEWGTLLCGGVSTGNILSACYALTHGAWTNAMLSARRSAASVWIDGVWWVTGGFNDVTTNTGTPLATSEVYDQNTQQWRWGVNLPSAVYGHCMVKINATHAFMTGGHYGQGKAVADSYIYSTASGFLTMPDMENARYLHACAILGNDVWVASGSGFWDKQSVEYFSLTSLSWGTGPPLPDTVFGGQLIAVDGKLVFAAERSIYRMENGVWANIGQTKDRNNLFVALEWNYEDCMATEEIPQTVTSPIGSTEAIQWAR